MADLVLVLTVMAFAGLCLLYVRGCERIIRRDEIGETTVELTRAPAEWMTTVDNIVGLVIAVALMAFLFAALLFPEKF